MPGSLLHSPPSPRSRVSRHESTRSDHSDGSNTSQSSAAGKKVSFNKAVRVKKYSRPKKTANGELPNGSIVSNGGVGSPEKRFWFKVYKNKHRQTPDPKELSQRNSNDVIYYDNNVKSANDVITRHDDDISYHPNPSLLNYPTLTSECGTQTPPRDTGLDLHPLHFEHPPLHPSQMPTELPHVKRNHVKKIVTKFNEEAVLTRQRSFEGDMSPPPSPLGYPRNHSTPIRMQRIPTPPPEPPIYYPTKPSNTSKLKKNPIVNGVKVMFGMGQLKKKEKSTNSVESGIHRNRRTNASTLYIPNDETDGKKSFNPYKTEITVSDNSETEVKTARDHRLSYGKDIRLERGNELVPKARGGLFVHDEEERANGDYDDFFANEHNDEDQRRRGKCHVETWDSGNRLVFDTTDVNTSSAKLDNGELFCTVGEKHQLWQNNKRMVVVEEPSPIITRRKAKSHSDLTNSNGNHSPKAHVDKGVSTEQLSPRKPDSKHSLSGVKKDSWLKFWTNSTKDKGIQCNEVPTSDETRPEEIYAFGKYKVVRPRNGVVSAYSNVPSLDKTNTKNHPDISQKEEYNSSAVSSSYRNGDIYSIVDKTKKKKSQEKKKTSTLENLKSGSLFKSRSEPLYIGPPPKSFQNVNEDQESSYYDDRGDHKVKTSRRSFGFRLTPGREEIGRKGFKPGRSAYREENWYDIDDDLEAAEKRKVIGRNHHDIAEVRQELADDEFVSDISSNEENRHNEGGAGSLMREVDYKKREISYENVPRSDGESNQNSTTAANSGLWFRDAEEDYRREMAQSEVSYPAGSHVGSDRFYTVSRTDKAGKQKAPASPRAYTLDRRHFKEQKKKNPPNTSGVKILVNGKEVSDKSSSFKKNKSHNNPHRKYRVNEDPSSVQSDPLYVRGGLAAAYQARQRAAVRRSNSSIAGIGSEYHRNSPMVRRRYQTNSEASGASSETESAHARRPLVMYIPGISHRDRSPDELDRSSGINVARSQSMMTASRPPRIASKSSKAHHRHKNKTDIYHRDEFLEDDDEIMPLASESTKKKPPKVPYDSKKNSDIKRRHSMPKDTKFSWLKWKIKGKPSREP